MPRQASGDLLVGPAVVTKHDDAVTVALLTALVALCRVAENR
jgi:hypothetical protein